MFKGDVVYAGVGNRLSPRAASEGEDFDGVDRRGFNIKTHRSRQNLEYVDKKEFDGHNQRGR